jgi:hypothetical protein
VHDRFHREGFVRVAGALDAEFCERVVIDGLDRIEGSPVGPVHLPVVRNWDLGEVAPRAARVAEELVGGAENIKFIGVQDNLIVNFPHHDQTWMDPAERAGDPVGWHKDGDWFRHFLDSPEQGLLVIVFWRDVVERQGPTYVAVDSIEGVARLLAGHPEGLDPRDLREPVAEILGGCRDLQALTGRQGDIVFAHPFMLHTASTNVLDAPRVISNSSVMLREPMRFDRGDASSPLERSILDALGTDQLDYQATGPRGRVDSERSRRWRADGQAPSAG